MFRRCAGSFLGWPTKAKHNAGAKGAFDGETAAGAGGM